MPEETAHPPRPNTDRPNTDRVNVKMPYEVQDWQRYFGIPRQELIDAVNEVGPMINDIEKYLGR